MGHSDDTDTAPLPPERERILRAFLENLTGPSRGKIYWLSDDALKASVGPDRVLRLHSGSADERKEDDLATMKWSKDSYSIEALPDRSIWVNGRKIGSISLLHGDMIEFGEHGPMSRYRLCDKSFPMHRAIEDILGDAFAYARTSRRPFARRMAYVLRDSGRRILSQTTLFFRINVIVALVLISAFGYLLYRKDLKLEASLEQEARRIEAVAVMLAQTREEALTPADLATLQAELETRVLQNTERLGTLEQRSEAPARVITASAQSVAFIQGAYGLRQTESGKLLRHVLGPKGEKLETPFGQPWIEPDGTGEPAEFQFTGTGFLLRDTAYLVTNRHVVLPWTSGNRMQAFENAGLQAEMLRLVVYLPDHPEPIEAEVNATSEAVDLAVLSIDPSRTEGRGLRLADSLPRPGEEVYLLGYPTGLKALLAQAGPGFLQSIEKKEKVDFWTVAARLSEKNLIRPLASRGIVAQISRGAVAYDAETTVGGSGGPALNRNGQVVAVNAAILPEFGGSNIGVPVPHLKALLEKAIEN
jgi:S1-C subfamily serine protease